MALFFPMSAQRRLWMHMGRLWMHMDGGESEEKTQKASPLTCQMTGKAGDARSKQKSRLKEFSQSRCIVFVFIIEDGTSVMRLQSHNIREKPMQSLQTQRVSFYQHCKYTKYQQKTPNFLDKTENKSAEYSTNRQNIIPNT